MFQSEMLALSLILQALLKIEEFIDNSIIQEAAAILLKDYKNGYWDYKENNFIWTIYDVLTALQTYLLNKETLLKKCKLIKYLVF